MPTVRQILVDAVDLLSGLFTQPMATLAYARDENFLAATQAMALIACLLPSLFATAASGAGGSLFLLLAPVVDYAAVVAAMWKGGAWLYGRGSLRDIAQICGLLWLPLSLLWCVFGHADWFTFLSALLDIGRLFASPGTYFSLLWASMNIGLILNLFVWFIASRALMVGHHYPDFKTARYVLVETCVIYIILFKFSMRILLPVCTAFRQGLPAALGGL